MSESVQKKLLRVRPPRVRITYDVHTNGAIEKRELPFIVGIFADLSGDREGRLLHGGSAIYDFSILPALDRSEFP